MNPSSTANPALHRTVTVRRGVLALLLAAALATLSGCTTIRQVNRVVPAPHLLDATLEQLIESMDKQYQAIQTLKATVDIVSSTGGAREGQIKENPSLPGYIILRKPLDLRVLMLAPFVRSRVIDMVSDGSNFKLLITKPGSPASGIEGPEKITTPSKNGLDNLRPSIIRDSLLIPAQAPDEYVTPTSSERIVPPGPGRKYATEEADYDIVFSRINHDRVLERVRVVHISRLNLLPYEQDIYSNGHIVTVILYDKYEKFGEIQFPTSISVSRPLDEYALKIDISKLVVNDKIDDEQFALAFPEGLAVRKMQ